MGPTTTPSKVADALPTSPRISSSGAPLILTTHRSHLRARRSERHHIRGGIYTLPAGRIRLADSDMSQPSDWGVSFSIDVIFNDYAVLRRVPG